MGPNIVWVSYLLGTGLPPQDLKPETFKLSDSLIGELNKACGSLYTGPGFKLFRGLNLTQYDNKQRIIIHAGLTSYFGNTRGYCTPFPNKTQVLGMHISSLIKFINIDIFY